MHADHAFHKILVGLQVRKREKGKNRVEKVAKKDMKKGSGIASRLVDRYLLTRISSHSSSSHSRRFFLCWIGTITAPPGLSSGSVGSVK